MEKRRKKPTLSPALALAVVALTMCAPAYAAPKYQAPHSFNGADGSGPYGGVVFGLKGNLFGTTVGGGAAGCCGTVFELMLQPHGEWTESVLHTFENDAYDGAVPYGSLTFDAGGDVFGTTAKGGAYNWGTAFELTPGSGGWTETVLYDFCAQSGCRGGGAPMAGLTMVATSKLYGTAAGEGLTAAAWFLS